MTRLPLLLLLFPLTLTSCFADPSRVVFAPSNDRSLPSFMRNGDLALENTFTRPLSSYVRETSGAEMAERIGRSEPFFVYLTSLGCAHCQKAKDAVCSFLQQTELEFLHLEGNAIQKELASLQTLLPQLEIPKIPGTPYLLRFDGQVFSTRSISDISSSPRLLGESLLSDINLSLTYSFRKEEALLAHEINACYFTADNDPHLPLFQTEENRYSLKEFAILELSSSPSASLLERFPGVKEGVLFLEGRSYEVSLEKEEALSAFSAYLGGK